jgi:hypothetical protein
MKTMLLAITLLAAPGAAFAQYGGYGGGYGGGGYGGGVYVAPPSYGYQPRYRTVCQVQQVAAGYDYYGQPIYRRQRVCQQVAY